ncbi:Hemicentin-1 [Folsomia candida]|uniref:Hemicentin-1 n=1 Tax=Folsomia candida TaxID=158441 RepID=A0A226E2S3_FOLCA|nr:Hemicentin-1 [Folsomia candida]
MTAKSMFPNTVLVLTVIILCKALAKDENHYELPVIEVTQVSKTDDYFSTNVSQLANRGNDEYYSIIGQDIIVGESTLGITLKCSASYPVYWTMNNTIEIIDDSLAVFDLSEIETYTTREVDVFGSTENQKHSAIIKFWSISPSMTNNYTCRSVKNNYIQSSRYIYASGYSQTYLVYAGQTFTIGIGSNQMVTSPCKIITPNVHDIQLKLFKERNVLGGTVDSENWELLNTNESISYDPHYGYSFRVAELAGILGWYKCTADDSNALDVLHFAIVTSENKTSDASKFEIRAVLKGSAAIEINNEHGLMKCCSNGEKPPLMKILFCNNPPECDIIKSTAALGKFSANSLSTQQIPAERLLYVTIQKDYHTNFHSQFNDNPLHEIFSGESFTFICYKSAYVFSSGSFWKVSFKNGTSKKLSGTHGYFDPGEQELRLTLKMEVTMDSVTCCAPVWNSTEWVSKAYKTEVQESSRPVPNNGDTESIRWTLNQTDRELECNFLGTPVPQIQWSKDDKILESNDIFIIHVNGSKSRVEFLHGVSHEVHGKFVCNGTNVAGTSSKVFYVYIEEDDTSHTIATVVSASLGLVSSLILVFVIWKFIQQRRLRTRGEAEGTTYQSADQCP